MKNTKIMAVLVVFLAAALFIGAASAAEGDNVTIAATPAEVTVGTETTVTVSGNVTNTTVGNEYNVTITVGPTTNLTEDYAAATNATITGAAGEVPYSIDQPINASVAGALTITITVYNASDNSVFDTKALTISAVAAVEPTPTPTPETPAEPTPTPTPETPAAAPLDLIPNNAVQLVNGQSYQLRDETGATFVSTTFTHQQDATKNITTDANGNVTISASYYNGVYETVVSRANVTYLFMVTGATSLPPTPVGPTSADAVVRNVTNASSDVFVFEHITIDGFTNLGVKKLTKFTDGSTPTAVNQISSDANGVFYLTEGVVNGQYGAYYLENTPVDHTPAVYIWYPELSIQAELTQFDATGAAYVAGDSIDGKNVNKDTNITFLINAPKVGPAYYAYDNTTPATANVVFTTPVSGKTTAFGAETFAKVNLNESQTATNSTQAGETAAAGTYTAQAEYMYPQCFADYAKKSNTISFTLQSSTLTITAAKDSVVRSNPFTVTISGKAQTVYAVFIEDYKTTSDIIPTLQSGQNGYQSGSDMKTTDGQIAGANFKTDASGKRTIQFNTAENTEDKTYTIKVQGYKAGNTSYVEANYDSGDYDKVKVKVEKGALTISASGDGSYYIGDEIKLTGTNTDSDLVFLFLTGQNLKADGIVLRDLPTKKEARLADNPVAVKTDNTWEYKWDTSKIALDTGAYTIYATSRLTNGKAADAADSTSRYATAGKAVKLSDSEYATVSVNLKQPFLSAVPSGTVIAQGDKLYVRGTAEGKPTSLKLYIFGPNFFEDHSITVEDDGTYEKKIDISNSMSSNQYFVVVQHPMYNNNFDAQLVDASTPTKDYKYFQIVNTTTGGSQQGSFVVWGDNKLQGSQAADALTKMIDDANIDDIYTKLTFTVAAPWIRINNPGDQAAGSKFTITGTTNLAVDDQILVEVMSSSFTAVDKTSTSTTSGVSQTTKVVAGDGADNTWSVDVDTTNWKLDEYTIKVNGIEVDVTTTTNFNLVEKVVTTAPTTSATTAVPTGATSVPTTTPTKTPGFGAFIALAGLGAVALLVLRRN